MSYSVAVWSFCQLSFLFMTCVAFFSSVIFNFCHIQDYCCILFACSPVVSVVHIYIIVLSCSVSLSTSLFHNFSYILLPHSLSVNFCSVLVLNSAVVCHLVVSFCQLYISPCHLLLFPNTCTHLKSLCAEM